ncbi:MAG: methyltransferase domain-containing protein [Patescibacteria group bacterium]|jgi:ubiquinone/menaquinone biosynthesis C-methylase UbiE
MTIHTGRALLDAAKILQEAGLSEGQTYVDFGCGTLGHFVLPAAGLVGTKGRVYAFDILPGALTAINERARTEKILPLETIWGDLEHERGTEKIPAASADLASLINITGVLFKSRTPIRNVNRVLKNGGRLLIVDWFKNSRLGSLMSAHPAEPDKIKETLEASGFRLLKTLRAGMNHYGFLFEKIR